MRCVDADLVGGDYTVDDLRQAILDKQTRHIICTMDSISGAEIANADVMGIRAERRITVFAGDYSGEKLVIMDETPYRVYRTYQPDRTHIQLYLSEDLDE